MLHSNQERSGGNQNKGENQIYCNRSRGGRALSVFPEINSDEYLPDKVRNRIDSRHDCRRHNVCDVDHL